MVRIQRMLQSTVAVVPYAYSATLQLLKFAPLVSKEQVLLHDLSCNMCRNKYTQRMDPTCDRCIALAVQLPAEHMKAHLMLYNKRRQLPISSCAQAGAAAATRVEPPHKWLAAAWQRDAL
jgi:hypothetical protein